MSYVFIFPLTMPPLPSSPPVSGFFRQRLAHPVPQETLHVALSEAIGILRQQAICYRDTLSADARKSVPPGGGWSVNQILQHLVVTHQRYEEGVRRLLDRAPRPGHGDTPWQPTWVGGMMVHALQGARRLPAPRAFRVGERVGPAVLERYLTALESTDRMMIDAEGIHWARARVAFPAFRLLRLNLGDCFALLTVHGERHFRRIRTLTRRG